ncbi:myo-inositol 2-dehydrogenase [Bryocella elongata]|uniref:Myo-inositol 2-dehydrogenase n=1 Tax=Bryocella elongata TaxID=863522 RepID=A0A1H5TDJ1_9BACT|nr:inositol 2-dehydrogenase [Bryocella elongata]SEF60922.1 myo-inositol 2-dehydrogenase [Bryocella elongata]
MKQDPLHIGIIGAGRIGRVHAESIAFRLPQARAVAITDANRASAEEVAALYGIPTVAASSAELLANPEIDAVLVCSSTDTHAQLIVDAALAGKHIFCEKPIALELNEIDRALGAVEKAGVKLQIGFNRRFDANFARVHAAVANGEIGTPSLMHIISRDPAPPPIEYVKVSGGMFRDMTIHDFDMARFLIGDEVESIYAAGSVRVDPAIGEAGDIDTALLVLHFRNGVIGTIDNSRKAVYGYDQRVEVLGSAGKISAENCYPNQAVVSSATNVYRDLPLNFFMDRYAASFTNELGSFVQAIRDDTPTTVNGLDGRMPVVMAMAARLSLAERRPVALREVAAV